VTATQKKYRYGKPVGPDDMPKARKRLPQYDECLKEFLESKSNNWEVDINSLPSKDPRVVLSSLKWRTKHRSEFENVRVIMHQSRIYLEKVRDNE
jgi:hypothetical protein